MSTHYNNVAQGVSGTPGTGTITLGSAVTGAQTLGAAAGGNATVDVFITDGNAWEVARNCTYTHSGTTLTRGTLEASSTGAVLSLTSAAIVRVAMPASTGNLLEDQLNRGLTSIANNSTTTQTTGVNTQTKIAAALTTVIENPLSWWDTTNKEFKPTRAGTYLVWGGVQFNSGATGLIQAFIRKNNTTNAITGETANAAGFFVCTASGAVYLNGSSDYVTLEVYTLNALTTNPSGNAPFFQAVFLG